MADGKPTSLAEGAITVSTESAQVRRRERGSHVGGAGPTPTPPPLTSRDSLRYEILGEYGRGGLGLVHRAYDRALGRDVAIKELLDRTSHVGEVRFLREAMITARLEHPGIVPVHEAGRWADGTPFYAMKLVAGRSLRDLIGERKTVDERIPLLHHVIAVADAIAYAHGKQIIHRDLKPANVIVGDFGETIVIDWGLAKDLTLGDDLHEPVASPNLDEASLERSSELTTVGSVIGTPAYMAPEQARGERVDQRADVFSIGAMLWELCALDHNPPRDPRQRERVLGRAGIDRDLIEIMQKALAGDPTQRYADAGALASDLKAFKSGAQITARRYGAPARLARWVRRRRALAATAGVALAVLAIGSVIFVRGLAIERDRADAASSRATRTANDLTLEHAELLLRSDPTAAAAALVHYHGDDDLRRRRLRAEADGLGTADVIATPHSDTIWMLAPTPDGGVISVGQDRAIRLTRNGATTTLTTDVSSSVRVAYNAARGLVAFATVRPGLAVLDVASQRILPIGRVNSDFLMFSPDGDRLIVLDDHQGVRVWTTTGVPHEVHAWPAAGALRIAVAGHDRIAILREDGVRMFADDRDPPVATAAIPDAVAFDARDDDVAVGTTDGTIRLLSAALVERGRGSVCRDRVGVVEIVPHRGLIAFACQDRIAGIARLDAQTKTITVVDTFDTRGLTQTYPDPSGRFVEITDESRTAYLYDLETRLLHHYDGSSGVPTYILSPSARLPFVVVGDANGTFRMWPSPSTVAHAVLRAPDTIFALTFSPDGHSLIAAGMDRRIHVLDLAHGGERVLAGHGGAVHDLRVSADSQTLLSVSFDNTLRTWRLGDGRALRTFSDHVGELAGGELLAGDRRVVSAGDDGRLRAWTIEGSDATVLYSQPSAIEAVLALGASDRVVTRDADNRVLVLDAAHPDRAPRVLHAPGGDQIVVVRASRDARWLATGTETGEVTVYDTQTWQAIQTVRGPGPIRRITFDPHGRDLAIATDPGRALVGHVMIAPLATATGRARVAWSDVPAMVRDIAYSPDGDTLAFVTGDGGTWLYAITRDIWVYTQDHNVDTVVATFSPDGAQLATCDRRGAVVVRNLPATFAAARDTHSAPQSSVRLSDL
jgi:WD40 repeat protein/tRNA A-37 threonylcarbamoyl transferase component Bud32